MKTYIIQLESHDDSVSVRDKLGWSKSARIVLVWPKRGRVLQQRLDLELVQRHAKKLGSQIGIVTHDIEVKGYAGELGIPAFRSVLAAQTMPWRRTRGKKKALEFQPRGRESLADQRAGLPKRWRDAPASAFARLAAAVLSLTAILLLGAVFMPRVEITLFPQRMKQALDLPVNFSTSAAKPTISGSVPARELSVVVEGQTSGASSGRVSISALPAEGDVTFTNITSDEVAIPTGTVVLTLSNPPVRYQTLVDAALAAGVEQTATVRVRAAAAGSIGNAAAHAVVAVEGDLGGKAKVDNLTPIGGGSDQSSPAPTTADYAAARNQLLENLQETAIKELDSLKLPGEELIHSSLQVRKIVEENRSPEVDHPSDRFSLQLRVEYQALSYTREDLNLTAGMALDAALPAGYKPVSGSLNVVSIGDTAEQTDFTRGELRVERDLESEWVKDRLIQAVRGTDPRMAAELIEKSMLLRQPAVLRLTPAWWFRMPYLPYQYEFKVE